MTEQLRADGIGRRLGDGGRWALRGVSLTLGAGARILLGGPSGSGKTLLLRSLALLDPVDEGDVLWRGETIADAEVPAFRSRIVYLHQSPALVEGTVEENLRLPFSLAVHAGRRYDRGRVAALLASGGFDASLLRRRASELSGGERQIVALARALQLEPEVLLLDEPTAALDPDAAGRVTDLIETWISSDEARAFLWVGHDLDRVRSIARRVLRLDGGDLREEAHG